LTQVSGSGLGQTVEVAEIGQDVNAAGPMVILALRAGSGLNTFTVEFYGSGFGDMTNLNTHTLGGATGNFDYPVGGGSYQNNENALFVLGANAGATVTWNRFNTESSYDTVTVYQWTGSSYAQMGAYSGSSLPPNHSSATGSFAVRFTSDSSVTSTGFGFSWA
jgi:hypothetical protein